MFHGIGGPDCPTNIFIEQMEYLSRHYSVISLKNAIEIVSSYDGSLDKRAVLTFDDGLKNNFIIAYPVLLRLGLPATFFVCPGLIESRMWLWAYEIEQRLLTCDNEQLSILCDNFNIPVNIELSNQVGIIEEIIEWMKTVSTISRKSIEAAVQELTQDFKPDQIHQNMFESMDWNELCSLSPDLITVGSHTITHPILTMLPTEEMKYEIRESRYWLERRLNRAVEYFCYPNGDYNDEIVQTVRETYVAAVATEAGFFGCNEDIYRINRIPAAQNMPLFAWRMFRPSS